MAEEKSRGVRKSRRDERSAWAGLMSGNVTLRRISYFQIAVKPLYGLAENLSELL
jgi:hypothetical protein